MTNIHDIVGLFQGNMLYDPMLHEPAEVKDDYKEFKDYTYNVKMSIRDINYFLDVINDIGKEYGGITYAKARFWKLLLDSGVQLEVKEKIEKHAGREISHERMFARPPFGCTKGRDKSSCELNKAKGCAMCEFNCVEELELSGKSAYANPNFVGFEEYTTEKKDDKID